MRRLSGLLRNGGSENDKKQLAIHLEKKGQVPK